MSCGEELIKMQGGDVAAESGEMAHDDGKRVVDDLRVVDEQGAVRRPVVTAFDFFAQIQKFCIGVRCYEEHSRSAENTDMVESDFERCGVF